MLDIVSDFSPETETLFSKFFLPFCRGEKTAQHVKISLGPVLSSETVVKMVVIESISSIKYILSNGNLYLNMPFCSAFHALSFGI